MASPETRVRSDWDITGRLLYHLSFTSDLIGIREEMMFMETCGLTLSQWRVMSVIASIKPVSSKDITKLTTLNKVAVSRTIARLNEDGLIKRTTSSSDSRIQFLSLTVAGKKQFRKARESYEKWTGALFESLSTHDAETLLTLLTELRSRLGDMTGEERARSEEFIFGTNR